MLSALRPHAERRLAVVFGAGGDRDRGKRPLMGRVATELADLVYVTDDNPRSEDPAEIRRAILEAAPGAIEIGDRRAGDRRRDCRSRARRCSGHRRQGPRNRADHRRAGVAVRRCGGGARGGRGSGETMTGRGGCRDPLDRVMARLRVCSRRTFEGCCLPAAAQKHRRMLYLLLFPLSDQFGAFNVFRYITFRSGGAVVTSLLISFIFGPNLIAWLRSVQREGQPIREDGPQSHLIRKKGTPTMGGFLILQRADRVDDPVGRSAQPVCVDRARRHGRVWSDRVFRRLPETDAALASRHAGPRQAAAADPARRPWPAWR